MCVNSFAVPIFVCRRNSEKWEDFGVPGAQEDVSNVNKVLVGQGEVFSFSLVMYY